MRLSKLFHVLVVQGAVLGLACEKDDADDEGGETSTTSEGESGPTTAMETGSSTADAESSSGGGDTMNESGSESSSTTTDTGAESTGGLECSDPPVPEDQCGCPCCWMPDCVNSDPCCDPFSELCT